MSEIKDSAGKVVEIGDIIECPEVSLDHAERYHVAFRERYCCDGEMEIRDLGNNNVGMYDMNGPFYVIGKWYDHLDKLRNDDLLHYFPDEVCELVRRARK